MRKNTYMIVYKIQHARSTEASSLIQNISVALCVSVNFVNENYDEKCSSTTFFTWLRRDDDELKIDSW